MREDTKVVLVLTITTIIISMVSMLVMLDQGPTGKVVESVNASFVIGDTTVTTTTSPAAAPALGGGGGGSVIVPVKSFSLSKNFMHVVINVGEVFTDSFEIRNTGSAVLDIIIEGVHEYMLISTDQLELSIGESKIISVDFLSVTIPGLYTGEIISKSGSLEERIDVIYEVESEKILYDINVDIPAVYRQVKPGGELRAQVELFSLGKNEKNDVSLTYFIRDLKGKTFLEESEVVSVENQISFLKIFKIPELGEGDYILYVQVLYEGAIGSSSQIFQVISEQKAEVITSNYNILMVIGGIIVLIVSGFLIYYVYRGHKDLIKIERRQFRENRKTKSVEQENARLQIKKKIKLLEKSYKKGYIGKDAYVKSLNKLKKS